MNKYLLLFLLFWSVCFSSKAQTIYFWEDFEGVPTDSGWTINVISGGAADEWRFDNPGNRDFGASISGGKFAIFDNSNYGSNASKQVELISPPVNLQGKTLTTLGFYEYFEEGFSGSGEVYFSTDNGTSWTGPVYSVATTSVSNPDKITVGLSSILSGVTNLMNCRVKFVWSAPDNSAFWWILDDVMLYNNVAKDAAALKVEDLPSGCVVSLETPVTVTIKNLGNGNISALDVNHQLNNDAIVTDTLNFNALIGGPLLVDGSYTHTFTAPIELSNGFNNIKLWTSNPDGNPDQFPLNDTIYSSTSVNRLAVADLPFFDGFEDSTFKSAWCPKPGPSGNGRIRIAGSNVIQPCDSSMMVMMDADSGTASIDALDLLVNLSGCVEKSLTFTYGNINDDVDPEDGLYISVDNGATYTKIYDFDHALSNDSCLTVSFNLDSIANANGIGLTANSLLRWRHAGNSSIETGTDGFYLDNVQIDFLDIQPVDAAMAGFISPADTITTLDTIDVKVKITNLSPDTMVSAQVNFQYGTDPVVTEFWGGCLGQGDTASFTFGTALVPSALGEELCVWVELPNNKPDLNSVNDSSCLLSMLDTSGNDTTLVNNIEHTLNFKIYPNPASGIFYLDCDLNDPASIDVRIYDLLGKEVFAFRKQVRFAGRHQQEFNLEKADEGIYILKAVINNEIKTARLIIVR